MPTPAQEENADWPAPVEVLRPEGRSPVVLICDHASNHIPAAYGRLGVAEADLGRHIAYDIGASRLTRLLAETLDATAFLGGYSRLLVDLNRPFGSPASMPALSEATAIPGNVDLRTAETELRRRRVFDPFHQAVADHLDRRAGAPAFVAAVHSFTPVFLGVARPWHAGVLHEDGNAFALALLAALRADPHLTVGENEPYRIEREGDYAVPVHGTDRGNPAALIEIRNDLIADEAGAAEWADRLAAALRASVDAFASRSTTRERRHG